MQYVKHAIPLIIGAIFLGVSLGIFLYVYARIERINTETADIIENLALSSTKEEQLRGIRALLTDTAPAREKANSYFIGADGVVDFLKTVEALGKSSKVDLRVDTVNVEDPVSASAATQGVPIVLKFSGAFTNDMKFLYQFEKLQIAGNINAAKFSRLDSASSTVWNATLNARFFKLVQ